MKKNLIFSLLIIVAVFLFMRHGTPNVPMPTNFQQVGNELYIPVKMAIPQTTAEFWQLAKKSNENVYVVSVFNNQRLVRNFTTTGKQRTAADGTWYTINKPIRFAGSPYLLKAVRVNPNGTSGVVEAAPLTAVSANSSQANAANAAS